MDALPTQFYLASKSPRRAELLSQLGYRFETLTVAVSEQVLKNESPSEFVQRLAVEKANAGYEQKKHKSFPVLGADTIIFSHSEIMGKPQNQADAARMLTQLSGNTHEVYTAVAVCGEQGCKLVINKNQVRMRRISQKEISDYWQTGEPRDKAAGYAVQGLAAMFIENIQGSYSGIMGLPLFETTALLKEYQIYSPYFNNV